MSTPRASGQGDRGKAPMLSHEGTPYQGDDVEIYYSTDPMDTVKLALKKCSQDLFDMILIDPMTEEIQAQIDELRRNIKKYGMSRLQRMLEVNMALQTPLLYMMIEMLVASNAIVAILAHYVWLASDHFSLASW